MAIIKNTAKKENEINYTVLEECGTIQERKGGYALKLRYMQWNGRDPDTKSTRGIMSAELIADHMEISVETASELLFACIKYGITERQGGGYVV